MRGSNRRLIALPSYQALSAGIAAHAAPTARIRRSVTSAEGVDHASTSASSHNVAGTISAWARAMLTAIARRTPRSGSAPLPVLAAASSTSSRVTAPPGPVPLSPARSTPRWRANARTAGAAAALGNGAGAAGIGGAGRGWSASSPTTVPVSAWSAFLEFDERRTDLDPLAGIDEQARDAARLRRWHFDDRLFGLDRDERLVGDDMIAFGDMPGDDLGFLQSFAEIGQREGAHA